jgi:hypothetical protein
VLDQISQTIAAVDANRGRVSSPAKKKKDQKSKALINKLLLKILALLCISYPDPRYQPEFEYRNRSFSPPSSMALLDFLATQYFEEHSASNELCITIISRLLN